VTLTNTPAPLHVCPLRLMPRVIAETGAQALVSVINSHLMPATQPGIAPEQHLKLAMSEADRAVPGQPHPHLPLIEQLIAKARSWDQRAPLVVHCFSGLNRSPAAAFIIMCARNPEVPEVLFAHRLRMASESAAPTRHMVVMADQLLSRGGRMTDAIDAIGYGQPAAEGRPFALAA
jgi:predicted protein tyrosine phosphatase